MGFGRRLPWASRSRLAASRDAPRRSKSTCGNHRLPHGRIANETIESIHGRIELALLISQIVQLLLVGYPIQRNTLWRHWKQISDPGWADWNRLHVEWRAWYR